MNNKKVVEINSRSKTIDTKTLIQPSVVMTQEEIDDLIEWQTMRAIAEQQIQEHMDRFNARFEAGANPVCGDTVFDPIFGVVKVEAAAAI